VTPRPVLVGLEPGAKGALQALSPAGVSGGRLARLCGFPAPEFLCAFDLTNLHDESGHPRSDDERRAVGLLARYRGRRLVALGRRVQRALRLGEIRWKWSVVEGAVAAGAPHPSGKNRFWNEPENVVEAQAFFRGLHRPCVQVEGPDGSGKSHLVRELSASLGLGIVGTQGPQTTWEECVRRIDARVAPGIVCDRSSGLVSELVYGPVLRGSCCAPETLFWDKLYSLRGVVTFVYCRTRRLRPTFRADEDRDFADQIMRNEKALAERYDVVMHRLERDAGARVVRYDWEHDNVAEVARTCVE
jgi:hypothetical protein